MKKVKLFILVIIMVILGTGCTMENLQNNEDKSSTLTLNVNWDEAVANESTNKVIEDAITKGYKVYAGIIKSSEVDKSGTINFKEKQEISYRTNKNVVFTIQEADYTTYHICIFIDKDGDGILSSWNHETIAYNYSLNVNSTSQTINMPIKITPVTSSSKLTFNVTWNQVVSTKGVEKSIIDEAITKGYKAYIGIAKKSDVTRSGIFNFYEKQEIVFYVNKNVEFTIKEADYGIYTLALFIDRNGDGADHWMDDIDLIYFKDITVNSTSQTIDVPVEILTNQIATSSTLTFNVSWNKSSESLVTTEKINEAITKGYKLYFGILKESEITRDGVARCIVKQEIEYNKNREVKFIINETDYTKYQAYIYIDKDGNGFGDGFNGEIIASNYDITVNSTSQSINLPVYIKE